MPDHQRHRGRRPRRDSYYSDDDYYDQDERNTNTRGRSRSKSIGRALMDRLGAFGDQLAPRSRSRTRSRSRRGRSRGRSRSRDRRHERGRAQVSKTDRAVHAAIDAAVVEVVRLRGKPGKWTGAKGARVATAAASAAVIDAMLQKQRPDGKRGKGATVEAVLGGLVANRLVNGKR